MNNHKFLCALAVMMMVGVSGCVPVCAQQKMSLHSLFDMADQQSQRIKVSEMALKTAEEGVVSAKSALLPSVELSVQGSYTGNAFLMSRGFSTSGTTEYIVPGLGPQQVPNGKHPTPHCGTSFTAQVSRVIYAGSAIRSGIENAVQANYTNLLTSSVEVSTLEKQVELADQNYAVVKNRYDNDLALLTDMLDASNMKLSADMALVNARINMLYNYFKLKYITNTL